jgi:putative oxidoreductase
MKAIRYVPFVGRLMIGLPFALSGLGKLAAIGPTTEMIRTAGLPLPPLALALSIAMEVGGGLLLVVGFRTLVWPPLRSHFFRWPLRPPSTAILLTRTR